MSFLSEQEQKAVEEAIRKAESRTSGEIVFVVTPASGRYLHGTLLGALLGMAAVTIVFLLLPFRHTPLSILTVEPLAFAVFYALLPRLPLRRWFISKQTLDTRVREAAFLQFYSSGLDRTRESNGVEIYLSLFERQVVVLGDRGIHARMGDRSWDEVRDLIIQGIREKRPGEGICAAIELLGEVLAEHFPARPDDINELPDGVIRRP
ncbi:MAG: hypothetical protein GXX81_01570 [Acidobacteria bacterium]|jgi:putative membrane protein|nr:hypothetical protein [Acidobacteriota bacterium]